MEAPDGLKRQTLIYIQPSNGVEIIKPNIFEIIVLPNLFISLAPDYIIQRIMRGEKPDTTIIHYEKQANR